MYILFIIILVYFIYYKYITILSKELDHSSEDTVTIPPDISLDESQAEQFENYNIKNSYIRMNLHANLPHYSMVSDEKNTIPYYIANNLKVILGDKIKLDIFAKTKKNLDESNISSVNSGTYNFAICTEYELLKLTNSENKEEDLENIRVMCSLNRSYLFFIVHDNSNIESLRNLGGKTIGISSKLSGSYSILGEFSSILRFNLKNIYSTGNRDKNTIYYETGEINELCNLFFQKKIDCLFWVSGHNIPYLFSLSEKTTIRIIDINEPELNIFNKKTHNDFFFLNRTRINIEPYGTFNNSRYLDTFYTRDILVCNSNISTKIVYNITKNLISNIENVKTNIVKIGKRYFDETQDPLYDDFKKEYMVYSNYKLPIHKGAYLYFKEIDMFVNEKTKCEFVDDKCVILPYEKLRFLEL